MINKINQNLSWKNINLIKSYSLYKDLTDFWYNLYKTGYFKNVKFNFENGFLSIDIIENPIIEKILISGVKNKNLLGNLNKTVKKIEKYPYTEEKIEQQKNIILI